MQPILILIRRLVFDILIFENISSNTADFNVGISPFVLLTDNAFIADEHFYFAGSFA